MESIYSDRVNAYGHQWYRPWLWLLVVFIVFAGFQWLTRGKPHETQVVCARQPGSCYKAAIEMDGLLWTADINAALACASKYDRRVFLAFHAVTDTNARVNELTVFRDRQVKSALRGYVLVVLYIDVVPDRFYQQKPDQQDQRKHGEANLKFEEQRFQTAQEPLYVVLQAIAKGDFEIVSGYDEARINDLTWFLRFLQDPVSAKLAWR